MQNRQDNIVIQDLVSLHMVQIDFYNIGIDIFDYDIIKT